MSTTGTLIGFGHRAQVGKDTAASKRRCLDHLE